MKRLRAWLYHHLFIGVDENGDLTPLNIFLFWIITIAVFTTILSTEPTLRPIWRLAVNSAELFFGLTFLIEYLARVYASAEAPGPEPPLRKRVKFMLSWMGLVDLTVVIACFAQYLFTDAELIRLLRMLRIVALFKFGRFSAALGVIGEALKSRSYDLAVTMAFATILLLTGATVLYWVEGRVQPEAYGSIPRALWWSVITLSTVGYGDVFPITPLGKFMASFVALSGIALVAMPTGIIAAAFSEAMSKRREAGPQKHIAVPATTRTEPDTAPGIAATANEPPSHAAGQKNPDHADGFGRCERCGQKLR